MDEVVRGRQQRQTCHEVEVVRADVKEFSVEGQTYTTHRCGLSSSSGRLVLSVNNRLKSGR